MPRLTCNLSRPMGRETFSMPKAGSVRGRPYHVISSQLACDTTPLSRVDLLRDSLSYERWERLISVAAVEVMN
jgi:hypothetical protein